MRRISKIILLAVLITVLALLAGCGGKEPVYGIHREGDNVKIVLPNLKKATELKVREFTKESIAEYSIVRAEIADQSEIEAAMAIRDAIKQTGINLSLKTDWVSRGEEPPSDTKEIIVGSSNRAENPANRYLKKNDFIIKFENDRLIICGGSPTATKKAAECFSEYFIDSETGEIFIPGSGEYLFHAEYMAESFKLNGIELYDYQLEVVSSAQEAADYLSDYIAEITGYYPAKESENKLSFSINSAADTYSFSITPNGITINTSENVGYSFAAVSFAVKLKELSGIDEGKTFQKVSAEIENDILMNASELKNQEPHIIHVSVDGSDDNDGSESAPLATIEGAKLLVRKIKNTTIRPIIVTFHEGEYFFTDSVKFDTNDSGNDWLPITYAAAEGEQVSFIGGLKVDPSLVKKAEDQSIIDRLIDKEAAASLMQIDLSDLIDSFPGFYAYGNEDNNTENPIVVYINGNALDRSRWPNADADEAYAFTDSVTRLNKDGSKTILFNNDTKAHIASWNEAAFEQLYVDAFLAHDWRNEIFDASNFDHEACGFTIENSFWYWDELEKKGKERFYFFNLPEEIDAPGESFIDSETLICYFLPEEDYDVNEIYISTLVDDMINMTQVKNIVFDGINFLYSRGRGLNVSSGTNITVQNCTFAHTSSNAVSMTGSKLLFAGNHVYDTTLGGAFFSGGNRTLLVSGECIVENNEIHDVNRDLSCYYPCIRASSVGMIVRHNELYNSSHLMLQIGANDVIVEYNDFHDGVLTTSDMGVIYTGRNPSIMGIVIRYNYFHQIGNPYDDGTGQQSIYNDDGNNGMEIYGNVFWQATQNAYAVYTHGAQFSNIKNNIFIDLPTAYGNSDWEGSNKEGYQEKWFMWLYNRWPELEHDITTALTNVKFDSELWREHYKGTTWERLYDYIDSEKIEEYAKLSDEDFKKLANELAPLNSNTFSENVLVNVSTATAEMPYAGGPCTAENNYLTNETDLFVEYGVDFTLTDEAIAAIRKQIPNFEEIDFNKIGLLDK